METYLFFKCQLLEIDFSSLGQRENSCTFVVQNGMHNCVTQHNIYAIFLVFSCQYGKLFKINHMYT
jgi:hypothetical protein